MQFKVGDKVMFDFSDFEQSGKSTRSFVLTMTKSLFSFDENKIYTISKVEDRYNDEGEKDFDEDGDEIKELYFRERENPIPSDWFKKVEDENGKENAE